MVIVTTMNFGKVMGILTHPPPLSRYAAGCVKVVCKFIKLFRITKFDLPTSNKDLGTWVMDFLVTFHY